MIRMNPSLTPIRFLLPLLFAPLLAAAAESKFPCQEKEIARYTAHHVREPIRIDGRLDEAAWQRAPRSPRFVDIVTSRPALHDTRAVVLWDDANLYIAFRVEEPLVHAKFTTNNAPIYYDNDVEVFIAGRDAYYEFELNAFNTTYEVFFQPIQGSAARAGFRGLGVEPSWRVGLAHSGVLPLHPVHDQRRHDRPIAGCPVSRACRPGSGKVDGMEDSRASVGGPRDSRMRRLLIGGRPEGCGCQPDSTQCPPRAPSPPRSRRRPG